MTSRIGYTPSSSREAAAVRSAYCATFKIST